MERFKVVITDHEYESVEQERRILEHAGAEVVDCQLKTAEQVVAAGRDADALIVQFAPITRQVIEQLPRCKIIAKYSTGIDGVDVQAATEHGIFVTNVSDYCKEEVSNQALALLLMLSRRIPQYTSYVQPGAWYGKPWQYNRLKDETVGVISFGKIARKFVEKLKPICDNIWVYDAFVAPEEIAAAGVVPKSLDEIIAGADYISIHCPLTRDTYHMFNRAAFARMKPNAAIINVARGGLVDHGDLLWAIENRVIRAAALDVLECEPPSREDPLLGHENIIITPHMGWYSTHAQQVLQSTPAEEVARVLRGGVPCNLVNPELLKA